MMFASPAELTLEWRQSGVEGAKRFLIKLWNQVNELVQSGPFVALDKSKLDAKGRKLRHLLHTTIEKVSDDIGRRQTFNTAIAAIMELLNETVKYDGDDETARALRYEIYNDVVVMLYPIVPHICFKLYELLGNTDELDNTATWPVADPDALKAEDLLIVVQVNGKVRAKITVGADLDDEAVKAAAQADEAVQKNLAGKSIKKVIYVKGRLVNIVAA